MAKRRADDTLLLLHDSPSKRCCRSLIDMQPESAGAPDGGVRLSPPPSLLDLVGSRRRKRPHYYYEDPENKPEEARKHAADGSFPDRRSSGARTSSKKRPRDDCACVDETKLTEANEKADEDADAEDSAYNSFQFWRVPLPELNLSLLDDANDHSQQKDKKTQVRDSSSDAMET